VACAVGATCYVRQNSTAPVDDYASDDMQQVQVVERNATKQKVFSSALVAT
jgi:hypothetical protein